MSCPSHGTKNRCPEALFRCRRLKTCCFITYRKLSNLYIAPNFTPLILMKIHRHFNWNSSNVLFPIHCIWATRIASLWSGMVIEIYVIIIVQLNNYWIFYTLTCVQTVYRKAFINFQFIRLFRLVKNVLL